jgi:hypothetical protein
LRDSCWKTFVSATDEADRQTLAALHDALARLAGRLRTAGFADAVPLAVAREAWLAGVDEPGAEPALPGRWRHLLHLHADARHSPSRWCACWA